MTRQQVIVLAGPTAVGKSTFLYDHLSEFPLYVLSADSMQVYRQADVLSASPSESKLNLLPHAGINEKAPDEESSVHEFLRRAKRREEELGPGGRILTVVGGTPLYLRSYLYGLDELPPPDEEFRSRLRRRAEREGRERVHERLATIDPQAAKNIHPNDLKRTIRALEIHHQTGRTKTELTSGEDELRPGIEPLILGLRRPAEELRSRIRRRCERMLEEGLVDEVKSLRAMNPSRTLRQAIGYEEGCRYLDGEIDRDELFDELESNTWEYARKQMTWFRQFPMEEWYHPDHQEEELIDAVEHLTKRAAC